MTRLASTDVGLARIEGTGSPDCLVLDLDVADLGDALARGFSVDELANAPVRNRLPLREVTLLPTVPRPSKIWAVGFAYHDHRSETGFTEDVDEPTIFLKAPSSVTATGRNIVLPPAAPERVDYEGELAVVIGTRTTAVDERAALASVAGFTICNDVSARDVQKGTLPRRPANVSAAKSFDTFTPMGPWMTTLDEFADPADLQLRTWVDGELRQDARTSQLIYPVPYLVSYLSWQTTLEPGDVIMTGTPGGVGHKQGKFLQPGSTVRIEIEGIGLLGNTCVGATAQGAGTLAPRNQEKEAAR